MPVDRHLVAVSPPSRVVGYVCGHLSYGDGLLPGAVGELHELYVEPEHAGADDLRRRLVEAAIARLRSDGAARTIRSTFDVHDTRHHELLAGLGFEADMITMSRYDGEQPPPGDDQGRMLVMSDQLTSILP